MIELVIIEIPSKSLKNCGKKCRWTDYYHISLTDDVIGIESAVALKNGYALGIALTIGLNQKRFGVDSAPHFNSQTAVFYQSAKEMKKFLETQGAREESFYIGVGDLYVTVYGGRTSIASILFGRGLDIDEVKRELNGVTLESLVVAKSVAAAVKKQSETGSEFKRFSAALPHRRDHIRQKSGRHRLRRVHV